MRALNTPFKMVKGDLLWVTPPALSPDWGLSPSEREDWLGRIEEEATAAAATAAAAAAAVAAVAEGGSAPAAEVRSTGRSSEQQEHALMDMHR